MPNTFLFILAILSLFSCKQDSKPHPDQTTANISKPALTINEGQPKDSISKFIHTRYKYTDPTGKKVIIENSLPKGGLTYTDPLGIDYVYTVFWTRILNVTPYTIAFNLEFPSERVKLPSSANNSVKIYLPGNSMSRDRESLFNYGLDVEAFFKNDLPSSSLTESIAPREEITFYVLTTFLKGLEGVVRAGLVIEGQELFYEINDLIIQCGEVNLPDLELQ